MKNKYSRKKFLEISSFLTAIPFGFIPSKEFRSSPKIKKTEISPKGLVDIGSRRQLFVDDYLIDNLSRGAKLLLHHPEPRELVMVYDKPWEGSYCNNHSIFKDGDLYRMYYAGCNYIVTPGKVIDDTHSFNLCYAESQDGIHWQRPNLELHEFHGSKANNILMVPGEDLNGIVPGPSSAGVFKDDNPNAAPDAKYKAMIGADNPPGIVPWMLAIKSSDGIHWFPMSTKPVITDGDFDSQNVAFWDNENAVYRAYWRTKTSGHMREVRTAVSKDFVNWINHEDLSYVDSPEEQLYNNVIKSYPRAPDFIIGLPVRYVERSWSPSMKALPELENRKMRSTAKDRFGTALTESLFMTSRDGVIFKRWNEAFLRPGIERPGTWNYGQQFLAWQIVETKSDMPGAPDEMSIYATESCWTDNSDALRRYTLRIDGFVSVNASMNGGELITRPLRFDGDNLELNFSTSAAGSIQVEIQDESGKPFSGFALGDCLEIFGDTITRKVTWQNSTDVSKLKGENIRLHFVIKDADLHSFKFH